MSVAAVGAVDSKVKLLACLSAIQQRKAAASGAGLGLCRPPAAAASPAIGAGGAPASAALPAGRAA
eukprot:4132954-Prymnesium_polylepis.1